MCLKITVTVQYIYLLQFSLKLGWESSLNVRFLLNAVHVQMHVMDSEHSSLRTSDAASLTGSDSFNIKQVNPVPLLPVSIHVCRPCSLHLFLNSFGLMAQAWVQDKWH